MATKKTQMQAPMVDNRPDFFETMRDAMDFGRAESIKGRAQIVELRKDPIKNASQIKFLKLAVGNDEQTVDNITNGFASIFGVDLNKK